MLPSSSSGLSAQGRSQRPVSSLSQRPSSSLSHNRPSSSASQRPPSSTSRPISSASTRPLSRVSQRPHSRHARSRLVPLCQTLVTQVTGLRENDEEDEWAGEVYRNAVEFAVKSLESSTMTKGAASVDMQIMDRQMRGHVQKAQIIHSRDSLAEALESSYKRLKVHITQENDLDQEIKMSRIPDHLELLIQLSSSATPETLAYADYYLEMLRNPPRPPPALTWKDILADEPFEGEHWEGVYGLPPGSVRNAKSNKEGSMSGGSSPSLSPLDSDDLDLESDDSYSPKETLDHESDPSTGPISQIKNTPPHTWAHRQEFEDLQTKQYWRDEWRGDANPSKPFDIGDASTLGPSLQRALAQEKNAPNALQPERFIDEHDAVREILIALQGRKNIMLTWTKGSFHPSSTTRRLIHLSLVSQSSILNSLADTATTAQQLRHFVSFIFSQSQSKYQSYPQLNAYKMNNRSRLTRTLEAFADAVDEEVMHLDAWCAACEEAICRAQAGIANASLVVSLLSTEKAARDTFEETYKVLLHVVRSTLGDHADENHSSPDAWNLPSVPPAVICALLLDTLFQAVQEHLERGDQVTADALMRVFVRSAEPVWEMIGQWLRNGMGLGLGTSGEAGGEELDNEFFIEGSGLSVGMMGMGLLDPDFWAEGYALREGVTGDQEHEDEARSGTKAIPTFLKHVAGPVLASGKAVGLLRALGVTSSPDGAASMSYWRSFEKLLASSESSSRRSVDVTLNSPLRRDRLFSVSVDTLSQLVYDELSPYCEATGALLSQSLVGDCELFRHLRAIEDLFLIRGEVMGRFIDVLFSKMDSQQSWGDFHFLNTAFNDAVEACADVGLRDGIQTSLVRLSYRGTADKDRSIGRTVKAISGLLVEYAIPFPLTYIFLPASFRGYVEIFVFLLQVRRAKSVLERILIRGNHRSKETRLGTELKTFYAIRSRLSWFINTLMNFLSTYVIHTQLAKFHQDFYAARSLDEIIGLHDDHLDKLRGRCLLQPKTSALHRAILSILDMALHFSDMFVAFAGDTTATLDISRHSIITKRHRSRRSKRQRRNVIGFSRTSLDLRDSSDDDDSDLEDAEQSALLVDPEPTSSAAAVSFASSSDEDIFRRMDKMSAELDGLVRFVRRGVESLAGGVGDAGLVFGVLAFALEDWDI